MHGNWVRPAMGVVVVAMIVGAAVTTALRPRSSDAKGLDVVAETAWVPDGESGRLVLADAPTARAMAAVEVLPANADGMAQTGSSAVVVAEESVMVIDGATWQPVPLATVEPGGFVAGNGATAWLVEPGPGRLRPITDTTDVLGATVVGTVATTVAGARADTVRVAGDGTLWALDGNDLRGVRADGSVTTVALGPGGAERRLTLVDDQPVVVERDRARRVDPGTVTVFDWAVLPAGDWRPADRSTGAVVALAGERLVVADDAGATIVDLAGAPALPAVAGVAGVPGRTEPSRFGPPVVEGGLVYVADHARGELIVVDPVAPAESRVTRMPVGSIGPVSVFAHHRQVWYSHLDVRAGRHRAGVVVGGRHLRPIDTTDATGDATLGSGGDGSGAGEGESAAPKNPVRTPPPPVVPSPEACATNLPVARCLAGDRLRPGAGRPGQPTAACPTTWAVVLCGAEGDGRDRPRPGGEGGGDGPIRPGDLWFTWTPEDPVAGKPVTFHSNRTTGTFQWTFPLSGGGREQSAEREPVWKWDTADTYRVRLSVDGGQPIEREVKVKAAPAPPGGPAGKVLPDVVNKPWPVAEKLLKDAGFTAKRHDRPSRFDLDNVHAVRSGSEVLQPGPVENLTEVDVDVSDGSLPVLDVSPGRYVTCALVEPGDVWCWGGDAIGRPWDSNTISPPKEVDLRGPAVAVTVGARHACALLSAEVWCWGDNGSGQLGIGDGSLRSDHPVPVNLPKVRQIKAGDSHTCAVTTEQQVWCWGSNLSGEVGVDPGAGGRLHRPVRVLGVEALSVDAGDGLTCAVRTDHGVSCWGHRFQGGDAPEKPRDMGLGNVDEDGLALGLNVACAAPRSGPVRCWGRSPNLGTGAIDPTTATDEPQIVRNVSDARMLAAGLAHACALVGDGLACWGANEVGQMGTGAKANEEPWPVTPGIGRVRKVRAGAASTCAVLEDQTLHCWGMPAKSLNMYDLNTGEELRPVRIRVP